MTQRSAKMLGIAVTAMAATASAQPERLFFEFEPPVPKRYEDLRVSLWAEFSSDDYALHEVSLDIIGSAGDASFDMIELVLLGPGTSAGVVSGASVTGIVVGQLNFPPGGIFADPSNPIELWQGTLDTGYYSPPDFIVLCTRTADFSVYPERSSMVAETRSSADVQRRFEHVVVSPSTKYYEERSPCYADCDCDVEVTLFDFLCYQNSFAAGDDYADCDGDVALTFFDFLCFQNEFAAGCR